MQSAALPSLKQLLLSGQARVKQLTPQRSHEQGKVRRCRVEALG
jgi:hypothetical protein